MPTRAPTRLLKLPKSCLKVAQKRPKSCPKNSPVSPNRGGRGQWFAFAPLGTLRVSFGCLFGCQKASVECQWLLVVQPGGRVALSEGSGWPVAFAKWSVGFSFVFVFKTQIQRQTKKS